MWHGVLHCVMSGALCFFFDPGAPQDKRVHVAPTHRLDRTYATKDACLAAERLLFGGNTRFTVDCEHN